eukprot:7023441-Lingulodinium_polyedra.AAC.1
MRSPRATQESPRKAQARAGSFIWEQYRAVFMQAYARGAVVSPSAGAQQAESAAGPAGPGEAPR